MQVLVMLDRVEPLTPTSMIEPGLVVQVVGGAYDGFMGILRENPMMEDHPFTVIVEDPHL